MKRQLIWLFERHKRLTDVGSGRLRMMLYNIFLKQTRYFFLFIIIINVSVSLLIGVVFQYLSPITVNEGYGSTIQAAVDQFAQHTCITWKPRENEDRWVTFVKKSGCV